MEFFSLFLTENEGCEVTETPRPKILNQLVPFDKEIARTGSRKNLRENAQ